MSELTRAAQIFACHCLHQSSLVLSEGVVDLDRYQTTPAGCLVAALIRLNRLVVATHRTNPANCFSSKCFAASSHTSSGTASARSARRVMDSARASAALSSAVKRSVSRQAATAKSRSSLSPAFLALIAPLKT